MATKRERVVTDGEPRQRSPYVYLVASDGKEFKIRRDFTKLSPVISDHLKSFEDAGIEYDKINLPFTSEILNHICDFLEFKYHKNTGSDRYDVPTGLAIELLHAACYLNI